MQRFANGDIAYTSSSREGAPGLSAEHQPTMAQPNDAPRPHVKLKYFRRVENEAPIPFAERIVYQDENMLVADKPHFLPVVPSGRFVQETLLARLQRKTGIDTLVPAHRIDRDTAGLVLFVVKPSLRAAYQGLFRTRSVAKGYEAIAPYAAALASPYVHRARLVNSTEHFMQVASVFGEPNSETHIEVVERVGEFARYRLMPLTGKRHQLRVHMASLGAPILNDPIYPRLKPQQTDGDERCFSRPLQLLAHSLSFVDPVTASPHRFVSKRKLDFSFLTNS